MTLIKKLLLALTLIASFSSNALMIKLDFSTNPSTDIFGYTTEDFKISEAVGLTESFDTVTNAILQAVREDYYSTSYGFIGSNQQLDIDFMIATVGTDVSGTDPNHYTIQIGSETPATGGLGLACYGCVTGVTQTGTSGIVSTNAILGSVFSNNIFSVLFSNAGFDWDLVEAVNAIAGTLSHEIGHALGLDHPGGAQQNPGESAYGIMGTGANPTAMPNAERLKNRAFSDINMEFLVETIGLRTVQGPNPKPVPEPGSLLIFVLAACLLVRFNNGKQI